MIRAVSGEVWQTYRRLEDVRERREREVRAGPRRVVGEVAVRVVLGRHAHEEHGDDAAHLAHLREQEGQVAGQHQHGQLEVPAVPQRDVLEEQRERHGEDAADGDAAQQNAEERAHAAQHIHAAAAAAASSASNSSSSSSSSVATGRRRCRRRCRLILRGDDGGERAEERDGDAVVEHRLAEQRVEERGLHAQLLEHRQGGHRVGGRDEGAEREALGEGGVPAAWAAAAWARARARHGVAARAADSVHDGADGEGGGDGAEDGEAQDGVEVREERAALAVVAALEDDRRQQHREEEALVEVLELRVRGVAAAELDRRPDGDADENVHGRLREPVDLPAPHRPAPEHEAAQQHGQTDEDEARHLHLVGRRRISSRHWCFESAACAYYY